MAGPINPNNAVESETLGKSELLGNADVVVLLKRNEFSSIEGKVIKIDEMVGTASKSEDSLDTVCVLLDGLRVGKD